MRTYLYLNGQRVAVNNLYNTNHGQYYYGSDILGSVRFITGQSGQELNRIEYDIFGGIYKGASPYGLETGYTGKPYDSVTGLSDYGFRDYSPTHARFITEDPIRDGENWFAYVGNNPVNWIDPWGLAMQEAALESDHCGGGGGACVAFGIVALVDYLGDGIKKAEETITDGVRQGAHWAGEKISAGASAATAYFSKGKKVRNKENSPIPPGNQNSQQRQGNELKPEKPNLNGPPGGNHRGGIIAIITMIVAKCSEVQQNTEESLSDLKAISAEAQKQVSMSNPSMPPMFEQGSAGTVPKNNKGK